MAPYEIDNRAYADDDAELSAALKRAHRDGVRPLCLCRPFSAKLPMVIERRTIEGQNALGDGAHSRRANGQRTNGQDLYILRRMPDRGHEHAPSCKHYEAPEGLSGRADHLGGAIRTDDDGAHHTLRLAFPLSHKDKAAPTDEAVKPGDPSKPRKRYARLSLLGFLHHVLEAAELTTMHKGLHGKRSWNVMRGRILETMRAQTTSRYRDLAAFSFAPRIFSLEHKDELFRDWRAIERKAGAEKRSIMLFAELKDIDTRQPHECHLTFKHLPQRSFALKPDIQKPFLEALERITGLMTGPRGAGHVVACAVVTVGEGDVLSIINLAMVATTQHWIPFGSMAEYRLLTACDEYGRSYLKGLDYGQDNAIASLLMTDTGDTGTAIFLIDEQPTDAEAHAMKALEDKGIPVWRCDVTEGRPSLPLRRLRSNVMDASVTDASPKDASPATASPKNTSPTNASLPGQPAS
ncbi:MAG: DUF1173 family protein [Bosea sp. (in: a-proteobacteria)]